MSGRDLHGAWRNASRAADLGDRLAQMARTGAERDAVNAAEAEEMAILAEDVARAATTAAELARASADRAHAAAAESLQDVRNAEAERAVHRAVEADARDTFLAELGDLAGEDEPHSA